MDRILLATGDKPEIVIETVGGDLRLTGWERGEFLAEANQDRSLYAEAGEERLTFRADADCSLHVPRQATLRIKHVGGDARLKALDGEAVVDFVGGDVELRQTGAARLGQVGGDVRARKVRSALILSNVGGDVSARGVAGGFVAENIGGDLFLRDVGAAARAGQVGGDIGLNLVFAPGEGYEFRSRGDIRCRIRSGLNARLTLQSGGDIEVEVPGAIVEGDSNQRVVTLGAGAARVSLQAGGDVTLTDISADPEAMGEFGEEFGVMAEEFASQIESQIESQVESQMADFEQQMADFERQLEEKLGSLDSLRGKRINAEEIAARARRAAERDSRKAEAAQRRAERDAERAKRHAAHTGHAKQVFGFTFGAPRSPVSPKPPSPPVEPVTDEERMTILRMLEQGKISVAEAEKLLSALEGQG